MLNQHTKTAEWLEEESLCENIGHQSYPGCSPSPSIAKHELRAPLDSAPTHSGSSR